MKKKRVLFMTPPYHCGVVESAGRWMPLPLAILAGAVRGEGYDAAIYDAMTKFHDLPRIKSRLECESFDYLCLTAITATVKACLETARLAKSVNPKVKVILGGVHPSFCDGEILTANEGVVDFIVRKEGEVALPRLLDAIEEDGDPGAVQGVSFLDSGSVRRGPSPGYIQDLDAVTPAWDALDWEDYTYYILPNSRLASVSSSRGCVNHCVFCSQQKFWDRSWRARDPGKFVAEIGALNAKYGANVFLLTDEYPTNNRERWEEILDRLIFLNRPIHLLLETCVKDIVRDADLMEKYRKAGIAHIYIGVEATDQAKLKSLNKNLDVEESREAIRLIHSHGMITETSFILGSPDETRSSIASTLKLALEYGPDFAHFLALTPWPYADMYGELLPYIEETDYARYNLVEPVLKPRSMTLKQVETEIFNCYRKYYMKKLPEIAKIEDGFKRAYLISSMRAMMNSSFLAKNLKLLGAVPETVLKMMAASGIERGSEDRPVDRPFRGRKTKGSNVCPGKPPA